MFEPCIQNPTTVFLGTIALIGGLASLTRTLYEGNFSSAGECVAACLFGSFVSLGLVAIYVGNIEHVSSGDLKYIGIASLIGLAGKEQKQIVDMAWRSLMEKFTNTQAPQQPMAPPQPPAPPPSKPPEPPAPPCPPPPAPPKPKQ